MLILAVPFYSAPDDELFPGESKGREDVLLRSGVPRHSTATRRVPPRPRNGLKLARKGRDRPKQPQSHALRSTRRRGVTGGAARERVRTRRTLSVRGRGAQNRSVLLLRSHPVFHITGKQPASNAQQTFCTQLYLRFPPNYEHRQKPKLTLSHLSIPT